MPELTYAEAARAAIAEEMHRDPDVWALGEDLGRGGVFGQYAGLAEEFGPERICDTPISEASIMGASVGAAMVGTRPIVEMRFSDFALCAVDELVNQAAKARYMFGGQARVPMVIREPIGIWRSSAAQHSQSLEAWYTHIPGLVVVATATPADNKGLLKSAIRSDDPVVYMEHKNLWGLAGEVPEGEDRTIPPRGRPGGARRHRRDGGELVAHGARLRACRRRARGRGDPRGSHRSPHPLAVGPRAGHGVGREDRPAPRGPRSGGRRGLRGRGRGDGGGGAGSAGAPPRGAPHSDRLRSAARGSGTGNGRDDRDRRSRDGVTGRADIALG